MLLVTRSQLKLSQAVNKNLLRNYYVHLEVKWKDDFLKLIEQVYLLIQEGLE